jgi:hypothetical protein
VIPRASITAWRKAAPWPENAQVEQDLVLTRALVELFRRPAFAAGAAFRGGTALHKLFFSPPARYSEDIDLVQRTPGPIGPLVEEIRAALDPWLGDPKRKAGQGRFTLHYRFEPTFPPVVPMRMKVEINTREHFTSHGYVTRRMNVANPWFSGHADVTTFSLPELLGTKLRALYQRKKGRDLYDLDVALGHPAAASLASPGREVAMRADARSTDDQPRPLVAQLHDQQAVEHHPAAHQLRRPRPLILVHDDRLRALRQVREERSERRLEVDDACEREHLGGAARKAMLAR